MPLCNFATIALYITCSSATLISPTGPEIHPSAHVLPFHSIASSLNTQTLPLMDNHELPADMVNLVIETLVTPCSRCRKSYSAIFTKQNVCPSKKFPPEKKLPSQKSLYKTEKGFSIFQYKYNWKHNKTEGVLNI